MDREFLSEHTGERTTLRAQLAAMVSIYKAALEEPDRFRPFRLN